MDGVLRWITDAMSIAGVVFAAVVGVIVVGIVVFSWIIVAIRRYSDGETANRLGLAISTVIVVFCVDNHLDNVSRLNLCLLHEHFIAQQLAAVEPSLAASVNAILRL